MADDPRNASMVLDAGLLARVGEVIARRYRLTRVIGAGGMGAVFEAEHVVLRKRHAVKLLHPALGAKPDIAARFEREAIATGRLRHPNCVEVSDFGRLPDGTLYLAMELLEGRDLRRVLGEDGVLPVPRAVHVMRQILLGLDHAHSLDVVHRDLKPDNVLLVERGGDRDHVKLVDFGIAKLLSGGSAEEQAQLTQVGFTLGTPRYMAPEQATGAAIDGRTDLYSATVVFFQLIAGRTPFDGEAMELVTAHVTKEPPAVSQVAPQPISADLDAVVRRGLTKDAGARFQSACDYLAALDEVTRQATAHTPAAPISRAPSAAEAEATRSLRSGTHPATDAGVPARPAARRGWRIALAIAAAVVAIAIASSLCGTDPDEELARLTQQLERGDDCKARLAAVRELAELGDARAVPALKKARYRMRGGVAGIGDENTNACLKSEAERAIERLQSKR